MVLKVPISAEAEAKLRRHAAAAGVDIETYAARWLETFATPPLSTEQLSGVAAHTSEKLNMSEEELSDFIESEIHAIACGGMLVVSRDKDLLDLMSDSNAEGKSLRINYPSFQVLTPPEFLKTFSLE